jgi:hypothetical protein
MEGQQSHQQEPAQLQHASDCHALCSQQTTATHSVTAHLIEIYQEGVQNGGWVPVLYETCGRIKKL